MINVTKTFLPLLEEYNKQLQRAWEKQWLTNRGELVLELEQKLKEYLNTSNIIVTNNGTVPLQIALKLLGNQGEIITTPFSYVATSAAIVWENCTPVFVDIHAEYLSIDETKIEAAITNKTTAILATHVFGNPCNVEAIEVIAQKHNLKVIYDAAHSFGVTYKRKSLFNYGDISTCSFHATKLFHTGEGGAMFTNCETLYNKMFYSHNFGHNGALDFYDVGINGKMSELQAAMGLSVLPYIENIILERKKVVDYYNSNLDLSKIQTLKLRDHTQWNFSYYPIIFESEEKLLKVERKLNESQIFPRRYFYPSLNTLGYMKGNKMDISENISCKILCLPLYVGLLDVELQKIVSIINYNL
ncbi:DegT/DnrJ/EryC1/StrS family aminotransferase [Flavobacterium johnsoniae]|uniref:DegT/DnrJ/EryC1/StrS aminotransferase n=1 Tax=Flavobacterium johnsoniae (strain ATCC 17061 / DSM 2064 / JCM 8514 / BCRC 14874 / CCUG 350202 / NBRC 14942 / NCIMB 11054 / UW101) TaxID=376686 RepID=A5FN57_FLAJ1|nr:DegT/DnrJ/EryC1/StrS family aminotransferase [Flavobacterium johnsoniae]ABQ03359.1 DegT/DnrJ/EryC1/StrS aminotransferase [Flavobacterium johnsoniae UW101]OXG01225.1 aminotransferase DegT [Flavobacterium johnsoniae UW101]WQG79776.1 DegT/DnrJ/EryC1/StrS family aminotransferase [Flavobacterium johnsoniae UW101]SHL77513.1 dTDP-4-amino-4,6-dideoxygalactose transaminase [Flavobacterium johnsoniae]